MSQPSSHHLDVHGAVDLSGLARRAAPVPAGAEGLVIDVTEANFAEVVQRSDEVPVLISLWSVADAASSAVTATLAELVTEMGGQVLLARVDVAAAPQVAQAVGTQTGSAVALVVRGQAVPLPPLERASREQIRSVLDQVVQMAGQDGGAAPQQPAGGEAVAEPLPPLHQQAYDAIERDDLEAAVAAYGAALKENPRDDMARSGLAQVELLRRTRGVDPAGSSGDDVEAQLLAADLDLVSGNPEAAFSRLVDLVRRTADAERERVRSRLIELFLVVGETDLVMAARRDLANALY